MRHKQQSGDMPGLAAADTMTNETQVFAAAVIDAVHRVIAEHGLAEPAERKANVPVIVQGLGVTAAVFSRAIEVSEQQFCEAMGVYYRQVCAQLEAAEKAGAGAPVIIVPGREN